MLFDEGQVWIPGPYVLGSTPGSSSSLPSPSLICYLGKVPCPAWLLLAMGDRTPGSSCPFPQGGQEAPERRRDINMQKGAFVT